MTWTFRSVLSTANSSGRDTSAYPLCPIGPRIVKLKILAEGLYTAEDTVAFEATAKTYLLPSETDVRVADTLVGS